MFLLGVGQIRGHSSSNYNMERTALQNHLTSVRLMTFFNMQKILIECTFSGLGPKCFYEWMDGFYKIGNNINPILEI